MTRPREIAPALLMTATLAAISTAQEAPARVSRVYSQADFPAEAKRSTLDPELAEWLKVCPRLGAHESIEAARRAHYALDQKTRFRSAG